MKLHPPFAISARLLPALKIADGWISLKWDGIRSDRKARFRWYIDIPVGEFTNNDLGVGPGWGKLQAVFGALLSFLGAAAESYRYDMQAPRNPKGENSDLFPAPVVEWAYQNSDEIAMMQIESMSPTNP